MTIQEMKDKKKEKGYTYAQIANLSGVPLGTVQKIFPGRRWIQDTIRFWLWSIFLKNRLR